MKAIKNILFLLLALSFLFPLGAIAVGHISGISIDGNVVNLTIDTTAGRRYQLKGCDDLAEGDWTRIGDSFIAEGTSTNRTLAASADAYWYKVEEISGYISRISASGATATLKIDTVAGARYQLQSCTNLTSGVWANLGNNFLATGPATSRVVTLTESACWYRTIVVPISIDPPDPT